MPASIGSALIIAAVTLHAADIGRTSQQRRPESNGSVDGSVTTQKGSIAVAGARVVATAIDGRVVTETRSNEHGRFHLVLSEGRYRVRATQPPLADSEVVVDVSAGRASNITLDLGIGSFTETVTVTSSTGGAAAPAQTSTSEKFAASAIEELPIGAGDPVVEVQRLAPGVIAVGGGVSIKGGRLNQSSLLLGRANVTDPSTGNTAFRLPLDAVQSVEVLPNPYAVEFGRFSSGVTVLETRRGGDTWWSRANNFIPSLRTRRGRVLDILGVERFGPQLALRGPLVRDTVFVAQSLEYRYEALDIRSRDQSDITTRRALNSLTRLDVRAGGQVFTATVSASPQRTSAFNLDTFTPPEVAADLRQNLINVTLSNAAALSATSVLESLVHVNRYWAHVGPRDGLVAGMDLTPASHAGRFFADQQRESWSYQWVESWSRSAQSRLGEHLFKVGVDLLHTVSETTRSSAPVLVRRVDGTVSRRLTFSDAAPAPVTGTDVALFAQDRWQAGKGWVIDAGVRLDRDGILGVTNPTARMGFMGVLGETGAAAVRGGVGLFYERTPSVIGAFPQFERITEERFSANGITPLAPAQAAIPGVRARLQTPRSRIWSAGYSHQLTPSVFARVNVLSRRSTREFIVALNQERTALTLESNGRSEYREAEVGLRYTSGRLIEVNASYTRSRSRASLNSVNTFYGSVPSPIIGADEYTVTASDVPNRLLVRLRLAPSERWLFGSLIEWRSGVPYGALDEFHEPVTPRHAYRMAPLSAIDLSIERRFRVRGWRPWIGIRVHNALNTSNAVDVQRRLDAPDFGATFNTRPRQIRLQLRFQ